MLPSLKTSQLLNSSDRENSSQSDRAKVTPKLPHLWVTDIIAAQPLVTLGTFAGVFSPETPPTDAVGQHILCFDPHTPELIWKAIAYELINKGCQVSVCQLGVTNYQPLEWYLTETPVPEVAVHIIMQEIGWKDWAKGLDNPIDLEDALNLAELAFNKIQDNKKRTIELDKLRQRCGVSSFNWNKYISDLEAEIHATVDADKAQKRHERVRLELQSLLKEVDPLKALDGKKFIAQRYGYKLSEIEQLLKYIDQSSKLAKPRSLSLDELFSLPRQGIDYVIPGMLPAGECVLLVASPKAGKSLLAYDAAFAVATGEDAFLGETVKQGKVLIIQCDESIGSATGRLIKRGFRREDADNVQFMDSFNIFQLPELEERLETFRPELVIIDSLRRISIGTSISENSAEFADAVYKVKELLFRYNAAGILIHHTNKNQDALGVERVRGSSAIAGAVWGVWELAHIPKPDPNNKKRLIIDPKDPTRILNVTARDIEGQRLKIELDPENNHWVNLGEDGIEEDEATNRKSNEAKILELLKSVAPLGLEASEINQHVGLGRGVYCYLNRLLGKSVIGSRPSSTDRRRTVYFAPHSEIDRKIDQNQGGGEKLFATSDPPSPPVIVSNAIKYSESLTETAIENRSQIDRKSIANRSQTSPVNNSNQEQVNPPEIDRKIDQNQGGEPNETVTSEPSQPRTWKPEDKFRYIGESKEYRKKYANKVLTVKGSRSNETVDAVETKDWFYVWSIERVE